MNLHQIAIFSAILGLILVSGIGDSQFFLHAATVWNHGKPVFSELIKSALGGVIGIITYWLTVRFLEEAGVVSPEIQTVLWFAITIVGIAILNKKFLHWQPTEQIIGVLVIMGIAWLLVKTTG